MKTLALLCFLMAVLTSVASDNSYEFEVDDLDFELNVSFSFMISLFCIRFIKLCKLA